MSDSEISLTRTGLAMHGTSMLAFGKSRGRRKMNCELWTWWEMIVKGGQNSGNKFME